MTSIFEGQPPKTRSFPTKTRVIWVPGTFFFWGGGGPFVLFLTFYIKPAIFIEAGSFHPQKTLRSNPRMPFLPLLPRSLKINMLYIVQWFSHSLFENVFIPKLVLLKGNILYYLCHPMRLQLESKYIYINKFGLAEDKLRGNKKKSSNTLLGTISYSHPRHV